MVLDESQQPGKSVAEGEMVVDETTEGVPEKPGSTEDD
jgi:hypothetical protein